MLVRENYRLDAGNLKSFPAPHVFTSHHVVSTKHVRPRLGEAGTVAVVGPARKLALLGPHQPGDFVFGGLMTMRAVQRSRLLIWPLVEKFTFIHKPWFAKSIIAALLKTSYGKMSVNGSQKKDKEKEVQCRRHSESHSA
jgi:hypothetical protein